MSSKKQAGSKVPSPKWSLNDRVLCRYATSDVYYEAKIIDVRKENNPPSYVIHYQGWNARHDEEIDENDADLRFKPYTPEEAEKARELIRRAQQERKKSASKTRPTRKSVVNVPSSSKELGSKEPEEKKEKIDIPFPLRKILTDDNNLINKQHMLPKCPARVTVEQIIEEYKKSLPATESDETSERDFFVGNPPGYALDSVISPCTDSCKQSADGFVDYFNMTVGSLLLYKIEKPFFADLYAREIEKVDNDQKNPKNYIPYARYFGIVHLLRMFTRFTDMLEYTNWSTRAMNSIVQHAQRLVNFLNEHYAEFYDISEYELVPPEYLKRVWV